MKRKKQEPIGLPQKVTFYPIKPNSTVEEIKAEGIKFLMANWALLRDGEVIIENRKPKP